MFITYLTPVYGMFRLFSRNQGNAGFFATEYVLEHPLNIGLVPFFFEEITQAELVNET